MIDQKSGEGKNKDNSKTKNSRNIKKIAPAHRLDALERLKKQRAILDARIQSTEARLKTTNRKQDTRRTSQADYVGNFPIIKPLEF